MKIKAKHVVASLVLLSFLVAGFSGCKDSAPVGKRVVKRRSQRGGAAHSPAVHTHGTSHSASSHGGSHASSHSTIHGVCRGKRRRMGTGLGHDLRVKFLDHVHRAPPRTKRSFIVTSRISTPTGTPCSSRRFASRNSAHLCENVALLAPTGRVAFPRDRCGLEYVARYATYEKPLTGRAAIFAALFCSFIFLFLVVTGQHGYGGNCPINGDAEQCATCYSDKKILFSYYN